MVIELFLIGVGLSMDSFAVSVCKGLGMEKINKQHAFLIGLYFGGFQALMPFLGWALGIRFQKYITSVDHWIAFFLLLFIGLKLLVHEYFEIDAVASLLIILAVIVISIGASLVIPQKKK